MPLQRVEKEVQVLQAGSNTRLEIPKVFVEMFGILKGDKFVWVFDPENESLTCQPILDANHKPEAPDSDANTCPECFEDDGKHKTSCSKYIKPKTELTGAWCSFCLEDLPAEKLYAGVNAVTKICRKCAAKAQIELLHPDDHEVIAECQQIEHDLAIGNSDRDKIMRVGLRQFRPVYHYLTNGEKEILLKEYTPSNGSTGVGFGSWKTYEKFGTKKALTERIRELESKLDCIIDGSI